VAVPVIALPVTFLPLRRRPGGDGPCGYDVGVSFVCLLFSIFASSRPGKGCPNTSEVTKEFPSITVASADSLTQKLQLNNIFFVAKRTLRDTNQEVLYLSLSSRPPTSHSSR